MQLINNINFICSFLFTFYIINFYIIIMYKCAQITTLWIYLKYISSEYFYDIFNAKYAAKKYNWSIIFLILLL